MIKPKFLYLIRHAKSSWDDSNATDLQRTLNKRGLSDAPLMAKFLKNRNVNPDMFLSSPAARALMTAEIFANEFNFDKSKIKTNERIYDSTTRDLITVIRDIEDKINTSLLFGHNPGITNFANLIGDNFIPDLPTCAIVGLELKINSWCKAERHCGKVIMFEYPKKTLQ